MDFTIRPVTLDDSDEILAIYAPYILETTATFECTVPSALDFRRRIAGIIENYPYLAAVSGGKIIGYAYAHRAHERAAYDWYAELSVYVKMGLGGNGVGTALYKAIIEILKKQNVQNLSAVISAPNPASEALHKKVGFIQSGLHKKTGFKLGVWRDTMNMDMEIGPHEIPPKPFVPYPEL